MTNISQKEEKIKDQMIDAILTYSDDYSSRTELEGKNFSVLKFIYYDVMRPVLFGQKMAC